MAGIQYSIKKNRLEQALLQGMKIEADGSLVCEKEKMQHTAALRGLDSAMKDCPWGRLVFEGKFPKDSVCYLYVAASNEKYVFAGENSCAVDEILLNESVTAAEKKQLLLDLGGLRFINQQDVLLYRLEGQYLWILIEVIGENGRISNLRVQAPGDNFMGTFPEVYREKNSFFHRYISVFSTVYNDFQEELDHSDRLLNPEYAPKELLELYARWLGMDVSGGFLEEETLRALIREAGELIRTKGTKRCIERLCELVLGETPIIIERSRMQDYVNAEEKRVVDRLYGNSPYDVTVLIGTQIDEKKKEHLQHLLQQFQPVRSRLSIVFLQENGILDGHSYLDKNAQTFRQTEGQLDAGQGVDAMVILQ